MTSTQWYNFKNELLEVLGYIPRFCDRCGSYFQSKTARRDYCSNACQREQENRNARLRLRQEPYKNRRNSYLRKKVKSNPEFRFKALAHKTVWRYLSNPSMRTTCAKIWKHLPYNLPQLKAHLESQFDNSNGFTWENYGTVWELDHIIPQAAFSFTTYDCKGFRDCWALSNLRPLKCPENLAKAAKIYV